MMLCQICQDIFSGQWDLSEADIAAGDDFPELSGAGFIWIEGTPGTHGHHKLIDLRKTFSKQCSFCAKLWDAIASNSKTVQENDLGVLSILPRRASAVYDVNFRIVDSKDHLERYTLPISLRLQPHADASNLTSRPAVRLTDQLLTWLTTCRRQHFCPHGGSGRPSRLLEVTNTIRLRVGVNEEYATLSHRWEESLQLLKDNLNAFEQGIPRESLSRTFLDAMDLTRSLGIRYLWIDALCIIQDSPEDWLKESIKMADVYSNSVVNIAATAVKHGLHQESDPALTSPFIVEGHRCSYTLVDTQAWQRRVEAGSLNKRAWVFQERILAPRTVHFARDQVWWNCEQTTACESGQAISTFSVGRGQDDYHKWCEYVEAYSRTDITFDSDRLIALAGVASMECQATSRFSKDYVAGLWRQDMPDNLLWTSNKASRQSSYIAPSWSWACMHGGVDFIWIKQKRVYGTVLAEVVDAIVETHGGDLGPVIAGRLTLRAMLLSISLAGTPNTELTVHRETLNTSVYVVWDEEGMKEFQGYWTLIASDRDLVYGLILESHEHVYQRVGFMSFPKFFLCQSSSGSHFEEGSEGVEAMNELLASLPRSDILIR